MEKQCFTCKEIKPMTAFPLDATREKGRNRCKKCRLRIEKEQRQRHPERETKSRLKSWYGMMVDDLNHMFAEQNGRCAICDTEMGRPVIDHCHASNRVRALLCFRCNNWLAPIEDEDFLERAKRYLAYHRANVPERPFFKRRKPVDAVTRHKQRAKRRRHARWAERPITHPLRRETAAD